MKMVTSLLCDNYNLVVLRGGAAANIIGVPLPAPRSDSVGSFFISV